ncbi:hypothetical protein [Novosphingobium sp.]|uniref:hypothetical protein n=1 Tax=Novosphingobium sp. TaxID=1874826 RepID=UPI003D0D7046
MEHQPSSAFAQLRRAVDQKLEKHGREFDKNCESAATRRAINDYSKAVEQMLVHPAVTTADLATKIEALIDSDFHNWNCGCEETALQSLLSDAKRLNAVPVSPALEAALAAWREAQPNWLSGDDMDANKAAFYALMAMPCSVPGDFLVKTYVNLIGELGCTARASFDAPQIGNLFDIDIDEAAGIGELDEAWRRAAYHDIDSSDLGKNLLAYGMPTFSPYHWMERTVAIDMRVCVIIYRLQDGEIRRSLQIPEPGIDGRDDDNQTEWHRLQYILGFSPEREKMLIEEICTNWPRRVLDVVLPVAEKVDA